MENCGPKKFVEATVRSAGDRPNQLKAIRTELESELNRTRAGAANKIGKIRSLVALHFGQWERNKLNGESER